MWHLKKAYNRIVARKVDSKYAQYLESTQGGSTKEEHNPRYYFMGEEIPYENIVGYCSNETAPKTRPQLEVVVDNIVICSVTDKKDAFRIMNALKRDYKDIIVRLK